MDHDKDSAFLEVSGKIKNQQATLYIANEYIILDFENSSHYKLPYSESKGKDFSFLISEHYVDSKRKIVIQDLKNKIFEPNDSNNYEFEFDDKSFVKPVLQLIYDLLFLKRSEKFRNMNDFRLPHLFFQVYFYLHHTIPLVSYKKNSELIELSVLKKFRILFRFMQFSHLTKQLKEFEKQNNLVKSDVNIRDNDVIIPDNDEISSNDDESRFTCPIWIKYGLSIALLITLSILIAFAVYFLNKAKNNIINKS